MDIGNSYPTAKSLSFGSRYCIQAVILQLKHCPSGVHTSSKLLSLFLIPKWKHWPDGPVSIRGRGLRQKTWSHSPCNTVCVVYLKQSFVLSVVRPSACPSVNFLTFSNFSPDTLDWFWWNLVGMKYLLRSKKTQNVINNHKILVKLGQWWRHRTIGHMTSVTAHEIFCYCPRLYMQIT